MTETPKNEDSAKVLCEDVKEIIDAGVRGAYASVEQIALMTFWNIGRRISRELKDGDGRAEYGLRVVEDLARRLKGLYGGHYSKRNLDYYCQFYRSFPDFEIVNARVHNLRWTHYRVLLTVLSDDARYWYLREASREGWSSRTLLRNVGSQYYQRLLATPKKEAVIAEMTALTGGNPPEAVEMVKSPLVAEFLNLSNNCDYTESELEKSIIDHISRFLMELGRGFSFVARQQHIVADGQDYFIDLVFYNYVLKCFFLVDLKTTALSHRDVGQMDMYVRMYDDLKRTEGDNPTIGLLLCAETGKDIAKYSVLNGNKQLFAAKYLTCIPSEDELRKEIERQKEIFFAQHPQRTERSEGDA